MTYKIATTHSGHRQWIENVVCRHQVYPFNTQAAKLYF